VTDDITKEKHEYFYIQAKEAMTDYGSNEEPF
jgi:hypothetical protein